mgnify:CR=1 FL=1
MIFSLSSIDCSSAAILASLVGNNTGLFSWQKPYICIKLLRCLFCFQNSFAISSLKSLVSFCPTLGHMRKGLVSRWESFFVASLTHAKNDACVNEFPTFVYPTKMRSILCMTLIVNELTVALRQLLWPNSSMYLLVVKSVLTVTKTKEEFWGLSFSLSNFSKIINQPAIIDLQAFESLHLFPSTILIKRDY